MVRKTKKSEGATRWIVGWLHFSHERRCRATTKADPAARRAVGAARKCLIQRRTHLDPGLPPPYRTPCQFAAQKAGKGHPMRPFGESMVAAATAVSPNGLMGW